MNGATTIEILLNEHSVCIMAAHFWMHSQAEPRSTVNVPCTRGEATDWHWGLFEGQLSGQLSGQKCCFLWTSTLKTRYNWLKEKASNVDFPIKQPTDWMVHNDEETLWIVMNNGEYWWSSCETMVNCSEWCLMLVNDCKLTIVNCAYCCLMIVNALRLCDASWWLMTMACG